MKKVVGKRRGEILIKCALAAAVGLLLIMLVQSFLENPAEVNAAEPEITLYSKDNKVPVYQAGKEETWILEVTNHTEQDILGARIFPEMGNSSEEWPFVTDYQDYGQTIDLPAGQTVETAFSFTQREDVKTGRYTIAFSVNAEGETMAHQKFYVNTTAKEESRPADVAAEQRTAPTYTDAGGFSNGDAIYSGGAGSGGTGAESGSSIPRVIVTGFDTDPAEVRAGDDFTLTIHLKNTSSRTRVSNMLFDLQAPSEGTEETQAPAFLPVSGSSSVFLDGIGAGQTADISL